MTDFFDDLERELRRAHRRDTARHARSRVFVRRRLPGLRATGRRTLVALAVVVALVAVVLSVARNSDVERQAAPQPAPRMEVVATDVERGLRFGLDGRVLAVRMLPDIPDASYEAVSGARISATCGTAPPGDPRGETTLTRRWPAGQTSLGFRFPRDVSGWCRLEDQSGSTVAFVRFPAVSPGARELITETADNWVRVFASSARACNEYTGRTVCEWVKRDCQRKGVTSSEGCRRATRGWAAEHRGATVQRIAISGDRAAATLASPEGVGLETLQLRRTATGEWLIDKLGPIGAVGSSK
jgi:hypothetical protein